MKICHVLSSLEIGGAERVALRIAESQRDEGHKISILAARPGPLEAACREAGLPVTILRRGNALTRAAQALKHFTAGRYDVVNAHNEWAHRVSLSARLARVRPLVMTVHGESTTAAPSWQFRAPVLDGVIACSTRIGERLRTEQPALDAGRIVVVDNGVALPPPRSGDALAALRLPGHAIVACVARLDPVKDLGTLLTAIASLPRAQLILVGDGPDRAALEARARELGIASRTNFLGFRADVNELLGAADVFALSSLTEGMSIAALEAMAAGLPVVATRVGGTPDVVEDGVTGILVPARDPGALAAALGPLLDDPARREALGGAGRERVRARFSLEATARRYLEAYDRFAGRVSDPRTSRPGSR